MKGDFSGPNNFVVFAVGIFVVGLIGYFPKLKGLSDTFMGLLIIVILLANKGFFDSFTQQIQSTTTPTQNTSLTSSTAIPAPQQIAI